jgi:ribose/xylose/arabinose/galactoside ABC-type transport system permease subunit
MFASIGKILITLGVLLILIGLILLVFDKIGFLGKLPGDIQVQKKSFEFHFPIVTCIVVSILLSILLSAFFLWFRK